MLRLIYDDDLKNPTIDGKQLAFKETIRGLTIMLNDRKRKYREYERKTIYDARQLLRLVLYDTGIDSNADLCNDIGNLYKNHYGERTEEDLDTGFDAGYNSAIREVLSILKREEH